jgi:hypothetical protein
MPGMFRHGRICVARCGMVVLGRFWIGMAGAAGIASEGFGSDWHGRWGKAVSDAVQCDAVWYGRNGKLGHGHAGRGLAGMVRYGGAWWVKVRHGRRGEAGRGLAGEVGHNWVGRGWLGQGWQKRYG